LLVGPQAADDAAVYSFADDRALVFTADFLTPVCDDPHLWGRLVAANCLSDIYAMGGRPLLALNLAGIPSASLPLEVLERVLDGGADKAAEAGVCVGGGHTIDAPEPFYGMAVVGEVAPDAVVRNAGAQMGDALVLTKPLGVGIIVTAAIADLAPRTVAAEAYASMERLNRLASQSMVRHGAHAATDVTGYGLIGHAHEMAEASRLTLRFRAADLPLIPEALNYAAQWCIPAGLLRNREYYGRWANFGGLSEEQIAVVCDPQTSGGLLIALPQPAAEALVADLRAAGEEAWIVGDVVASDPGRVLFV